MESVTLEIAIGKGREISSTAKEILIGADIDIRALNEAKKTGIESVNVADATKNLPYKTGAFEKVLIVLPYHPKSDLVPQMTQKDSIFWREAVRVMKPTAEIEIFMGNNPGTPFRFASHPDIYNAHRLVFDVLKESGKFTQAKCYKLSIEAAREIGSPIINLILQKPKKSGLDIYRITAKKRPSQDN